MTYAFTFDASACSGCKACQAACKDKNSLPTAVLWRRVYEVSGGSWSNAGVESPDPVWENSVFAYNLSLACNHCVHPKCAGVCPVNAYTQREDGIVILDSSKCIGCGYCSWACPYGAPQYNPSAGCMTKCNFCYDNLEVGLPPACVAACPLRALDYVDVEADQESRAGLLPLWKIPAAEHPFPLPNSRTQPHLALKPHIAMNNTQEKVVANREEIRPQRISAWDELPLIVFTLLAQLAVGAFWFMPWMFSSLWNLVEYDATLLRLLPSLVIGACLGLGMLTSFAHLGTKKNIWRVLAHLKKSWLSRELLFAGLFGVCWLLAILSTSLRYEISPLNWLTALLGFELIYSMSQVYRLKTVPAWNSWRTNVSFFASALLLGPLAMACVLAYEFHLTGIQVSAMLWSGVGLFLLIVLIFQLAMTFKFAAHGVARQIRIWLLVAAMLAVTFIFLLSASANLLGSLAAFLIVLAEEFVGRWQFYAWRISGDAGL